MEKILICPGERAAVGFLSQAMPLVTVPMLGGNLLTYWIESLATAGVKKVQLFVTDRPEAVRSVVGDGSRWGMQLQVRAELRELNPDEATARLAEEFGVQLDAVADVVTADHLPGLESFPLFRSYRDWFGAVQEWIPQPAKLNRMGVREVRPGVWSGRRTRLAPDVKLEGPCWLGDHVRVGADAVIGPHAILENGVVIDGASEVRSSLIGPDTFIGALTKIEDSIAWGSTLIDWRSGSCTQVPDPFLMCALGQRYLQDGTKPVRRWWRQALGTLWLRGGPRQPKPRLQ